MLLYHGTIYDFNVPSLLKCRNRKDFGRGFYLTDSVDHAKSMAYLKYSRSRYAVSKFIYVYDIDVNEMRALGLNVHRFENGSIAWLDYLMLNRFVHMHNDNYDVVVGQTADSRKVNLLNEKYELYGFNMSNYDKRKLINDLNTSKYGIQYCFKTNLALRYLIGKFQWRSVF